MDAEQAKAKLSAVANELGHEIRVFTSPAISAASSESPALMNEESDDFYDLTPDDYYKLISDRMGVKSQVLKTRKLREAEAARKEAVRRARMPKAVIRVRFPDNYILEAKFQSSDKIQSLVDLLMKVVARPNLPFYLYTTPPKQRISDMFVDYYSAGFAPGANVYFSYDLPKGSEFNGAGNMGPYLRDDILSLNGLNFPSEKVDPVKTEQEPPVVEVSAVPEAKPAAKKPTKPKWLRM